MSFPSTYASGTQAATVGTEHFLSSPNVVGTFQLHVDLNAMVAGDVVELRVYRMAIAGGTSRPSVIETYSGAQPSDELVVDSYPYANSLTDTNALRFSLKQTFGTSRNFSWRVTQIQ